MLLSRSTARSARTILHVASPSITCIARRRQSTLESNPHIYVFPNPSGPTGTSLLTLLRTNPPTTDLAIASTTELPPTPASVTENPHFMHLLQDVVGRHATEDPDVQSQAKSLASHGGAGLGSGGMFFPGQRQKQQRGIRGRGGQQTTQIAGGGGGTGGGGAGGASAQGGMGGGGVGGFVHVSDQRNPPDWGRISYPEDILGSVQVDGEGRFVGERGGYQASGTYRVCTREGILKLSSYLHEKVVQRLQELEKEYAARGQKP